MYKVLLADDEILDIRGMQTFIPWEQLNMEVVAAVNSGFAALDYMNEHPVDILITDIRMPNMSGLELTRMAIELNPELKTIFISGYEDFHYVKQALQLNAKSYVLKPIDDDELIAALESIKSDLERQARLSKIETGYKLSGSVLKNEYLLQLLQGTVPAETLRTLEQDYGVSLAHRTLRVVIIELDDLAWKLSSMSEQGQDALIAAVCEAIAQQCELHGIRTLCRISPHRLAFILEHRPQRDIPLLSQFIGQIKLQFPFTITIGLGSPVTAPRQIAESYQEAKSALDYKMLSGKSKIISFDELQKDNVKEVNDLDMALDALFLAMSQYELVRIHDELETLFALIRNMKSKATVYNFAIQIISGLDAYLNGLNENLFKLLNEHGENIDILFKLETIDDIQAWLRKRVFEISEILQQKKQKKNSKLIESVCAYVEQRLSENITLRDVGNYFSFSPNYLGLLFKEGTGSNFSDYVIERRMELARKLLQEPQMKIFEIADHVGYKSLTYFSRQFKDKYGMSPGEYRKKC
ncbi:response regulator [Paenibacillus sp. GCM10027626]|uniref:response regulator n=1 Tax=Paenibacillus sp. GCM10027626 TaxID=3273411 RepID=UPI003644976D